MKRRSGRDLRRKKRCRKRKDLRRFCEIED
jgi:hypothetical protein